MGSFFSRRRKQPKVKPKNEPEQKRVSAVTNKPTVSEINIGDAFVSDRLQLGAEDPKLAHSPENKKRRELTLLAGRKEQEAGSVIVKHKQPAAQSEYFDLPGAVPGSLDDSPDEDSTNAEGTLGRQARPTAKFQSKTTSAEVLRPKQHKQYTTSLSCLPTEPPESCHTPAEQPESGAPVEAGEQEDENSNVIKEGTVLAEIRNVDLFGALGDEEFSRLDLNSCSLHCSEGTQTSVTSGTDVYSDDPEESQRSHAFINQSALTASEPSATSDRQQPADMSKPRCSVSSKAEPEQTDQQTHTNTSLEHVGERRVRIECEKEDLDDCPGMQRLSSPSIDEIVACSLEQIMQNVYTTEALEVSAVTGTDWKALARQLIPPDLVTSTVPSRHRPSSTKYCEDCTVDILDQGNDEGDGRERSGYDDWKERLQDDLLIGEDGAEAGLPAQSDTDIAEDTLDCNVDDRTPSPPIIEDIGRGRGDQDVPDASGVDLAAGDTKGSQQLPENKEMVDLKAVVQIAPWGGGAASKPVDDSHEEHVLKETKTAHCPLEVRETEAVTMLLLTGSLPTMDGGEDMCRGGGDSLSVCTDQSKEANTEEGQQSGGAGCGGNSQDDSTGREVTEGSPSQDSTAEQAAEVTQTGDRTRPEVQDDGEPPAAAPKPDVCSAD